MKLFADSRTGLPALGAFALLAGATLVSACADSSTGPDDENFDDPGRIQILLTDAPTDMLDTVHVWISRIYLVGGGGSSVDTTETEEGTPDPLGNGKIDLFNDSENPLFFDVLTLRDGVTADLTGEIEVDPTTYQGVRFVIDSTRVVLKEEFQFDTGEREGVLKVPSGSTSGVKVKIDQIVEVGEDETLSMVVDFDVDENFMIQQHPQTGDIRSIRFRPVLREKSREKR